MKRAVTMFAMLFAIGCATYQRVEDGGALKIAGLQAAGREVVAWEAHDTAALPKGMESLVTLKKIKSHINDVAVNGNDGVVTTTYWYTGTFATPTGQREGTMTVQRRLRFRKDATGAWTQSAPPEEIARNSAWSSRQPSS